MRLCVLVILIRYDAMQLSSGKFGAFSYVCWPFLIRYDAMQLSSGIPGAFSCVCWQFFIRCDAVPLSSGMRHSPVCAGTLDQVRCYATVKWNSWGILLCVLAIFRSSMMLCYCEMAFLRHSTMCAGNFY